MTHHTTVEPKRLVVIDTETTGLHAGIHLPIEVAYVTDSYSLVSFVPWVPTHVLTNANPEALAINRFYERRLFLKQLDPTSTVAAYAEMFEACDGAMIGGHNVHFDVAMIIAGARAATAFTGAPDLTPTWTYQYAELSAYFKGQHHIQPGTQVSLSSIVDELGLTNTAPHTAGGDALVTWDALNVLAEEATSHAAGVTA